MGQLGMQSEIVREGYRYWESRRYVGHWFSEYPNYDATGTIWPRHKLVVENLQPMLQRPTYIGPHNDFIYVENILLPLGATQPGWGMQMMFIDFIRKKLRPSRPFT